jgi:hypothetical protein
MPQSASLVGPALKAWFPQNNSTSDCSFYNTVVLTKELIPLAGGG